MKVEKVRKRDGTLEDFDRNKIEEAVWQAAKAVGGDDRELSERLAGLVEEKIMENGEDVPRVEQIQDTVEKVLVEEGHYRTAKAFILYRHQHKELRNLQKLFEDNKVVEDYVERDDWRIKENSNMTYSLQGLNIHLTEEIIENYWLDKIYPSEITEKHREGFLHIHDLGVLGPYCVGWDIQDLLMNGFKGVRGKIESSPAKHFDVALFQLVNFLYTLQGEAAGAQAVSNFDTYLAPFIHYDDLSYDEVKQHMQKFIYNMNVPTRVGFQTPFTNISMDLEVPSHMEEEPVIIGGDRREKTYGEFQDEVDMVNRAFAEVMMEGDAKGRPFTFPIPTYSITEDFDWDNPTLEPVWRMTAKYGIPYFSNFINSDMDPEDARSMCCRLRLDNRELEKRGGGLFGSNPLTGSIGVVTLNLPRLAYLSDTEDEFFSRIEENMDLARDSLEIKRKVLERLTGKGLYPYSRFYLRKVNDRFGNYWENHFSTIGLIGMNEALMNLKETDIAEQDGKEFAEKVLEFMRDRLADYQEETGHIYNLEATPAEGSSYRLAKKDREEFPDLKIHSTDSQCGEEPIYTNSTQLPFGHTSDLFSALDNQDDLQSKYTGGTVFHAWLGEKMPSVEATKRLVKRISENYELPYYTLTPTFSVCPTHGYINGEHEECPECGERCEVYSRVVGYLRPTDQWNPGKQEEYENRADFLEEMEA